ncbi:putative alpha-1,2-mannosidase [Ilumatobacter fluminis]|uniref:Putative alpha-1,2-mannosidase n=1 Tax=Ilumatobacter fluminis TaxID=467091 RepID=A0A4R7I0U5_9ACTN|nr:glycoside hydrolase domain-containing protein [Ilumatobacter fluminis]TDT17071.1 putative alpha-1,2-mannosidase [Ilumatobacter fluminis]
MFDRVDPFIGTDAIDLSPPEGIAATWWFPKPQVGNTHPGACHPFGMVSACAYSGAYPTGYGVYDLGTEGLPTRRFDHLQASGFTHFQQSGTGAIRKYYNYVRVTPMLGPLDELGTSWRITDEVAEPGYYACTLESGIRCEITVGPKSAVHRYTFPSATDARVVVDLSQGGLAIDHGATVPLRAHMQTHGHAEAAGQITVEGAPLSFHLACDSPGWRQSLWYDRRLMEGSTRLEFDDIRPTTLRPFGLLWRGPVEAGGSVELRIGFSLRGTERAASNLSTDIATRQEAFDTRRTATKRAWREHLGTIAVETDDADRETVFASALYHSLIKPCFAPGESPFWPADGPFVFDLCTMWDIYRTQLPLISTLFPQRSVELANALLHICEEEGNLPIGYRMARGADRFARQGSALAHTFFADLCALEVPGIDWDWALSCMHSDLRRGYAEDYLERGVAHPITHTLDVAFAYHCTAVVSRQVGDEALAGQLEALADGWTAAFDQASGLLVDSSFYEGGKWNYSFRILHDMATRIGFAGGDRRFVALLDEFFGYHADPVKQPGERPAKDEMDRGYALNRFEGMNNEPDMEAPWAYHYAGRPDRTTEVVRAAIDQQFGPGRGGLAGNDDSGGLSSWYVWASLGLFPVAGQNLFLVNAPSFAHATVDVGGTPLTIEAPGFVEPERGRPCQYVQEVRLDGEPVDRSWLGAHELRGGRRLDIVLGDRPSTWATSTRPPSASTSDSLARTPGAP